MSDTEWVSVRLPAWLLEADSPRNRAWTRLEALFSLECDIELRAATRSERHYAARWRRSRGWVRKRLAEFREFYRWIDQEPDQEKPANSGPSADLDRTTDRTDKPTTPRRGKKTAPPERLSVQQMEGLHRWVAIHKRDDVRLLLAELDVLVERGLAWHRSHDTRHVKWYAAMQNWILGEPKKRAKAQRRSPQTRSDGWDQAALKL